MFGVTEYHRPKELSEALRLLGREDVKSVPLAGGTQLVGTRAQGVQAVVDLRELGLEYITVEPPEPDARGGPFPLQIGATVSLATIAQSGLVQGLAHGLLSEATRRSASATLRAQATLGGTLAVGDARHPLLAALLALDAELVAWIGTERRQIPLDAFLDYRAQLLEQRALIVEARVPRSDAPMGGAFEVVARTPADSPIVCAAARVFADPANGRAYGVRVALGGVAARPARLPAVERALEGQVITPELIARVQALAREAVQPAGDWLASAEYRREMAGVLARRVVQAAWERSGA